MVQGKDEEDELRWTKRNEDPALRLACARSFAEILSELQKQIWVRVRLGDERRVDVARENGCAHQSAITHLLRRLETRLAQEPSCRREYTDRLRLEFAGWMSSYH